MKKLFSIIICILLSKAILAQRLELFGGLNTNDFHCSASGSSQSLASSSIGTGYGFGVGTDFKLLDTILLGLVLKLDHYKGGFLVQDGGHGRYSSTDAKVTKTVFSIGAYPLNVMILKRIRLSAGMEVNFLIQEKITGEREHNGFISVPSGWGWGSSKEVIDEEYASQMKVTNCKGLITRISYDLKIANKLFIVPQYQFFYGLNNEFVNIETNRIRALRHNFYLGIAKYL